ncbi:MAG: ferrous iron transport protein A [Eubacteriales bacterium]
MSTYRKLCDLSPGESATVCFLEDGGRNLSTRLADLGLTAGAAVTCTMRSPLGDPCAYLIRGAVIALRRADAGIVAVRSERAAEEAGA